MGRTTKAQVRNVLRKRYRDLRDNIRQGITPVQTLHPDDKRIKEQVLILRYMKVLGEDVRIDDGTPPVINERGEE